MMLCRCIRSIFVVDERCFKRLFIVCFGSAVEDYAEAREFDSEGERVDLKEGLDRAQKLLKISRKRDYYKILGVGR